MPLPTQRRRRSPKRCAIPADANTPAPGAGSNRATTPATEARARVLRLGFVPLTDGAPLIMAQELGLFAKYGLRVALSRELGWATIRDKIIHGEIDAAHALAPMPFAATLGLGSVCCPCLTGLVLNLHGNAITLSQRLWTDGIRDAASLREGILNRRRERTFTFGAVAALSSHLYLLRTWLAAAGIQPDRDVRIVIVPPPQMVSNLKAGHLDGFCAGEPWNSMAVRCGAGWCAAVSAELAPGHPEKVLMVRRDFAESREKEHLALVAALLEACEFCDRPENRTRMIATLSRPEYVGVPAGALEPGLSGVFDFGHGRTRLVSDFTNFHHHDANEPTGDKAAWIVRQLREHNHVDSTVCNMSLGRRVFSHSIYESAAQLVGKPPTHSTEAHLSLSA